MSEIRNDLRSALKKLSLVILGEHLWEANVLTHGANACMCNCCDEARKAHQLATGEWPTTEEEHAAMREWAQRRDH